jgi:hypothetical protein
VPGSRAAMEGRDAPVGGGAMPVGGGEGRAVPESCACRGEGEGRGVPRLGGVGAAPYVSVYFGRRDVAKNR